ncbi:M56 family metallopeptidase [Pedobacter immunditicola]|uniref:M56 family metallopeptidase n=1 Tax=Pedobacter immunditicola TaxID=3133440 RepID=UPI0030973849
MEALVNNIIKATGWSIFHSLWQGAFLYGLLVLIFIMVPKLSARVKHDMAYGTICLIFIGFCGTFFSVFTWPPLSTVTHSLSLSKVIPSTVNYQTEHYFPLLVGLYVIGLLLQLAILSTGYYKILKLKHSLKLAVPTEWQVLFQSMRKELKIKKNIGFYLSHQVNVPLVIGFIKPVVLFPVAFATQLDLVHVEAILIHELGHIRRNDYLLNIVKTAMETILFFNPFTWLCSNLVQREREHACDDLVLHKTHTPLTYAHALLQIELLKEKDTPVFSMAAGGNNHDLYQRIKRITDMKTTYNTAKQQLFAIGITIATLISLAWVNPLKSEPAPDRKIKVTTKVSTVIATAPLTGYAIAPLQDDQDTTKKKTKTITKKTKEIKKSSGATKKAPALPAVPPAPPAPPVPGQSVPAAPPAPVKTPERAKQMEKAKLQMEKVRLHFNSAEWKKHEAELKNMGEEMRKHFNSPEFKKEMEELKRQNIVIVKRFNSPEWKKHELKIKADAQRMKIDAQKMGADARKMSIEMERHFNSPEFKKQIEKQVEECNEESLKKLDTEIEKAVEATLRNEKVQESLKNK